MIHIEAEHCELDKCVFQTREFSMLASLRSNEITRGVVSTRGVMITYLLIGSISLEVLNAKLLHCTRKSITTLNNSANEIIKQGQMFT